MAAFFFGLMVTVSNPFTHRARGHADRRARVPTRSCKTTSWWPSTRRLLYLGLVGFTVPFAFACASLITGRVGEGWLIETRRWTLFAWGFLTVGVILGAWWSYQVLGLGRLLGLGPGRERRLPPVDHRDRLPAFGDGPGAAGHARGSGTCRWSSPPSA